MKKSRSQEVEKSRSNKAMNSRIQEFKKTTQQYWFAGLTIQQRNILHLCCFV